MVVEREGIAVDITANVDQFVGGIGQAISSLGGFRLATAAAAGAGIVAFGVASVRSFATYEEALEQVRQKHGLTNEQMSAVKESLDAVGASAAGSRFSQVDLANALNAVAQGSRDVGASQSVLAAAMAFTTTRGGSLVENAKALSDVLDVTGRSGDDATRVMEQMRAAADFSGLSMGELGDIIKTNDQRAKNFGLSLEDLIAISAALGAKGQDPRMMFAAMSELQDPSSAMSKALLDDIGVKAHDAEGRLRPFRDIMEDINIQLQANTKSTEEDGRMLTSVFGERAGVAINAYRLGTLELAGAQLAVANSAGQMAADVEASANTTTSKLGDLRTAWGDLTVATGEAITPLVVPLLEALTTKATDAKEAIGSVKTALDNLAAGEWDFNDFGDIATEFGDLIPGNEFAEGVAEDFVEEGPIVARLIGETFRIVGEAIWNVLGPQLATVYTKFIAWRDGANAWLVGFVQKVAAGIGDLGSAIWNKLAPGLASVKQKFDSWMSQHPLLGSFIGGVPFVSPVVQTLQAIGPQTPQASSSSTTLVVENVSLPNVTNPESFARELQRMSSRASEFDSQYRSLSYRRGVVG